MLLRKTVFIITLSLLFIQCKEEEKPVVLKPGIWRGTIKTQNQSIPFNFNIIKKGNRIQISLINGKETLTIDEVSLLEDSLSFNLHIFDAEIKARIVNDSLKGYYRKNFANNYSLPFEAVHGKYSPFDRVKNNTTFNGKWETKFINSEGDQQSGIGLFEVNDTSFTGTFLTATGDYRYLNGYTLQDTMFLYSFDGDHLYKFRGVKSADTIQGEFWSGKTGYKTFKAIKNEKIELPDAYSLTYLKKGYDKIDFSFKDLQGNMVSLEDPRYQNKVVLIQILGTWCPNCMDETRFLADWYKKNKHRGVEIIGLAYERKPDFTYAKTRVQKMKEIMGVDYEVLIAGVSTTESASESLPMLNQIISFPTSITIDKTGTVRKIHTGFNGPATGKYYDEFVREFNLLMDTLLNE
jgi:thiol-disulfide isomerase/thioredoxin